MGRGVSYEIIDGEVVSRWSGEGRKEMQAVYDEDNDEYEVRAAWYQENGRFGQSPATFKVDELEAKREAEERMEQVIRQKLREEELEEIQDLVEEVGGIEAAREALEEASG